MDISYCLATSSGTLSVLTGYRSHRAIDNVMDWWVEFELAHPTERDGSGRPTWVVSWERFVASPDYAACRAVVTTYQLERS